MKNSKKIIVSSVIIILVVLLGIMTFLYWNMRNTAKDNLDELLKSAKQHSKEMGELNNEIDNLKNQINKNDITSVTNATLPYVPGNIPVANKTDDSKTNASEIEFHRSPENVTIEVLKDTVTKEKVEILITDKNQNTYGWGEDFRVQKKENGNWEDLKWLSDNLAFNALAYLLDENQQLKMTVNYAEYYGNLEKGIYRIVKPVYDGEYIDLYSDEFEIK